MKKTLNVWNADKAEVKKQCAVLYSCVGRFKLLEINDLISYFKKLEEEQ